jgi:hypothetical protein
VGAVMDCDLGTKKEKSEWLGGGFLFACDGLVYGVNLYGATVCIGKRVDALAVLNGTGDPEMRKKMKAVGAA